MADETIAHESRICTRCEQRKPLSEFGKMARNPGRLNKICKSCVGARQIEWQRSNAARNASAPLDPPATLLCSLCGERHPFAEFGRRVNTKFGRGGPCLECGRKHEKYRYRRDRADRLDAAKWSGIKWRFGITKAQFDALIESQEFRCVICACDLVTHGSRMKQSACIDHDHSTNRVRGILCMRCNQALGLLQDDAGIVARASAYLLRHRE